MKARPGRGRALTGRRAAVLGSRAARPPRRALDVLAVGAHPDDVELGCGGTLALLAGAGRAVGIVHLTSGEAGSRGTAEVRRREAATAARALGVVKLEILDCGDAGLRTGRAEEDALIEVLRRLRPRLVLGPPPSDRHPDHGRAHALLRDACFYAGLAKRSPERGAPHRPAALFCYLQHDLAVPTFVVDVTAVVGAQGRRARRLRVAALARRRAGRRARSTAPPGNRGCAHVRVVARVPAFDRGSRPPLRRRHRCYLRRGIPRARTARRNGSTRPRTRGPDLRVGIACHPTVGGSGVVATELARALAEGGDEVHLMSYAVPPRWTWAGPRLFFHEVAVAQYPLFEYPPYDLALATKMVEVARQHRLDLLHVHYAVPNAVAAILARQILAPQPIKVITTLHGTDITLVGNDPSYAETTRFGIVQSDQVTAVSEALKRATHETFQIQTPIDVVPNFIDPRRFHEAIERGRGQRFGAPGERILAHVSNFRPVKRVADVVSIFHRIAAEIPSRLLLVGDGPELPRAERQARELGVRDRVDLIGTVANIEDVLAHVDLFLLPSEIESFGLAALEALACEVPVIASRRWRAARGDPRRRERVSAAAGRRRRDGRGGAHAAARRGPAPRVRRRRPAVGGDQVLARGRGRRATGRSTSAWWPHSSKRAAPA